jgi:hypothetical protein
LQNRKYKKLCLLVLFLGFPEDCREPEEKERYLEHLRETCSFDRELKLNHIENNPPRITVSKLSANALVGKLGKANFYGKIKN